MAFSKIILNGTTLMDVTGTGATENDVTKGKRFTDVRGLQLTGKTILTRGGIDQDQDGYLVISEDDGIINYYTLEQVNQPQLLPADGVSGQVIMSGTKIRPYLFKGNTGITSFVGNNIVNHSGTDYGTGSNSYAFQNCTGLKSVSMTSLKALGNMDYIFDGCTNLETIILDWKNLTGIGAYCFRNCKKFAGPVVVPKYAGIFYAYVFGGCTVLTTIDAGSASQTSLATSQNIAANAFNGSTVLNTLILRQMTVRPLVNISAFTNTPFASGKAGGTLYVPQALVSSYTSATNWSTIIGYANNTVQAIEGSIYETEYADGTSVPQLITNTLTNCTSSNTDTTVLPGESFSTTITADSGYSLSSVTVTMKRVDVTSTVYNSSNGTINIVSVDGPIVITATAE